MSDQKVKIESNETNIDTIRNFRKGIENEIKKMKEEAKRIADEIEKEISTK